MLDYNFLDLPKDSPNIFRGYTSRAVARAKSWPSRRLHHAAGAPVTPDLFVVHKGGGGAQVPTHPHAPESLKSWLIEAPGARITDTDMVIRVVAPDVCVNTRVGPRDSHFVNYWRVTQATGRGRKREQDGVADLCADVEMELGFWDRLHFFYIFTYCNCCN